MHKSHALPSFLIGISLVLIMWMSLFADKMLSVKFYEFGILPKTLSGLKGIVFSPLIHDNKDYSHIINNSIPTLILTFILHQRFTKIFWKVFFLSWILCGLLVWVFAENTNSFHIGMSGLIYAFASFIFTIGVIIKYLPYQALSLFIVFVYGSLIWGIFPSPLPISWEGHLSGLLTGIILAILYRKKVPQRPKYSYEIEKDLGIEPPDLEALYYEQLKKQELEENQNNNDEIKIVYDYKQNQTSSQKQNKK